MSLEALSGGAMNGLRSSHPSDPNDGDWRGRITRSLIDGGGGVLKMGIVIHALILREARTRYGRRSASYAWALIVPLLMLTLMILAFTFMGRAATAGGSLPVFFLSGILPVFLWRNSLSRGATAIASNRALMNYPQVGAFEVVTARTILELVTSWVTFLIFALVLFALFETPLTRWVDEPLNLLGALGALGLFCYGSAFLSAQIGRMFDPWSDIAALAGRIMFFTAGVWFTFSSLPPALREVIMYNPLAHIIEWMRDAAFRDYASTLYDPIYPVMFGLVCLTLGLFIDWLYRISGYDMSELT